LATVAACHLFFLPFRIGARNKSAAADHKSQLSNAMPPHHIKYPERIDAIDTTLVPRIVAWGIGVKRLGFSLVSPRAL
jgi:hypothetical protein